MMMKSTTVLLLLLQPVNAANLRVLSASGVGSATGGAGSATSGATGGTVATHKQGTGNTGSCSWLITCQSCAASESCGWCTDCGRCVEGGVTGPSSTNCVAWDYDQCSGDDKFADLMLDAHQNELNIRKKLIEQYDEVRDQYVRAKEEVASMEQGVLNAAEMNAASKSVVSNDASGSFALNTEKETTGEKCNEFTKSSIEIEQEYQEVKTKLDENSKIITKLESDKEKAMERGDDDTSKIDETMSEYTDVIKTTKEQMIAIDEKKALINQQKKEACDAFKEASTKEALHKGALVKAGASVKASGGMEVAIKGALKLKKEEATRTKAKAIEISEKIKRVTKELRDLRNSRTAANAENCQVTDQEEQNAKKSIEEFEECVDCQSKV
jgi:hypothetical protein